MYIQLTCCNLQKTYLEVKHLHNGVTYNCDYTGFFFLVFYDIISMTSCPCPNSLTSASCASPFFTLHGYGNAVVNSALCLSLQTCCVVLYILPLCLLWLCLCSSGAGADFVMMGGMLAGHDQCSGEVIEKNGKKYKLFYGMSSDTAMKKYTGGVAEYR